MLNVQDFMAVKDRSLSEIVSGIMTEKDLSGRAVATRATKHGHVIDHSTVNRIKNGNLANPSSKILKALASGLDVKEYVLMEGVNLESTTGEITHDKLVAIDFTYEKLPTKGKERVDYLISMLEREIKEIERAAEADDDQETKK